MSENQPVQTFKIGHIDAAIWAKSNQSGRVYYSVSIAKSYQKDNEWKKGYYFDADDLATVAELSRFCLHWILSQQRT